MCCYGKDLGAIIVMFHQSEHSIWTNERPPPCFCHLWGGRPPRCCWCCCPPCRCRRPSVWGWRPGLPGMFSSPRPPPQTPARQPPLATVNVSFQTLPRDWLTIAIFDPGYSRWWEAPDYTAQPGCLTRSDGNLGIDCWDLGSVWRDHFTGTPPSIIICTYT